MTFPIDSCPDGLTAQSPSYRKFGCEASLLYCEPAAAVVSEEESAVIDLHDMNKQVTGWLKGGHQKVKLIQK